MSDGRAGIARTLGIARSARRRLAEASLLGAGAIGASIALMGTSAWLISRAAEHPSEASLTLAIVGVQFFGLSRGFLRYGERLRGHDAALRVLADVRVRVFERLEAIAPAGLPVFRRGDLVARFVDDVDSLQDVVLRVLQPFLVAALVGAGTVAALWWFLPQAGLVLLVALALSATAVPWLTGRLARRVESQQSTVRGELTASVVDLVEGAPELLVMGSIGGQLHRIEDSDGQLRRVARHAAGTTGIGLGLTTALAGLASWGALTLGVGATHAGTLNGALLAVLALVPLAAFELSSPLPAATQALQRSRVAAARVFEAVDAPAIVTDPATPLALDDGPGPHVLTLEGVWASYPGARRAALRGVDLQLSPGRRVALVGPSGAGKSTLADVLVRFLPADAGEATLDGVAMERLAADDVRRVVGLVEQSPHLFDTTLAENLRVGRRAATDAELADVLARVGLGPWLAGLPKGLCHRGGIDGRTPLGRATPTSRSRPRPAGQLPHPGARRACRAPRPARCRRAHRRSARLTEGRSTLLITHRLTGLEQVDEIVVLDEGRVVERGTHRDLLDTGGRYADLWWEERMNAQPPVEPRPPSPEGLSAVLNEGSDTP